MAKDKSVLDQVRLGLVDGFQLDRTDLVQQLQSAIRSSSIVLVCGPLGSGRAALCKQAMATEDWFALEGAELGSCLPKLGGHKRILVRNLDQVLASGDRRALRQLVLRVQGEPQGKLLATCGRRGVSVLRRRFLNSNAAAVIEVPGVSECELEQFLTKYPQLLPILRDAPGPKNLYQLSLLAQMELAEGETRSVRRLCLDYLLEEPENLRRNAHHLAWLWWVMDWIEEDFQSSQRVVAVFYDRLPQLFFVRQALTAWVQEKSTSHPKVAAHLFERALAHREARFETINSPEYRHKSPLPEPRWSSQRPPCLAFCHDAILGVLDSSAFAQVLEVVKLDLFGNGRLLLKSLLQVLRMAEDQIDRELSWAALLRLFSDNRIILTVDDRSWLAGFLCDWAAWLGREHTHPAGVHEAVSLAWELVELNYYGVLEVIALFPSVQSKRYLEMVAAACEKYRGNEALKFSQIILGDPRCHKKLLEAHPHLCAQLRCRDAEFRSPPAAPAYTPRVALAPLRKKLTPKLKPPAFDAKGADHLAWAQRALRRELTDEEAAQWPTRLRVAVGYSRSQGRARSPLSEQVVGLVAVLGIRDHWEKLGQRPRKWCLGVAIARLDSPDDAAGPRFAQCLPKLLQYELKAAQEQRVRDFLERAFSHSNSQVRDAAARGVGDYLWEADPELAERLLHSLVIELSQVARSAWTQRIVKLVFPDIAPNNERETLESEDDLAARILRVIGNRTDHPVAEPLVERLLWGIRWGSSQTDPLLTFYQEALEQEEFVERYLQRQSTSTRVRLLKPFIADAKHEPSRVGKLLFGLMRFFKDENDLRALVLQTLGEMDWLDSVKPMDRRWDLMLEALSFGRTLTPQWRSESESMRRVIEVLTCAPPKLNEASSEPDSGPDPDLMEPEPAPKHEPDPEFVEPELAPQLEPDPEFAVPRKLESSRAGAPLVPKESKELAEILLKTSSRAFVLKEIANLWERRQHPKGYEGLLRDLDHHLARSAELLKPSGEELEAISWFLDLAILDGSAQAFRIRDDYSTLYHQSD